MKVSRKLFAAGAVVVTVGYAIALAWALIGVATGDVLSLNGPWLLAVLALLIGSVLAVASILRANREDREEWELRRCGRVQR